MPTPWTVVVEKQTCTHNETGEQETCTHLYTNVSASKAGTIWRILVDLSMSNPIYILYFSFFKMLPLEEIG